MKTNTQIITREFAEKNILFFFPTTAEEAKKIQDKLFALGFAWGAGVGRTDCSVSAVTAGIKLVGRSGERDSPGMYSAKNDLYKDVGLLCTLAQFDVAAAPVPAPQLLEEIRALREELTAVNRRLDEMAAEQKPKKLDKPGNKL